MHECIETSKISLQNLQSVHSMCWLCVLDVIFTLYFDHLLRGVQELFLDSRWRDYPWESSFQRLMGNSRGFPETALLPGNLLTRGSGEVSVFLKEILSDFLYYCFIWYRVVNLD